MTLTKEQKILRENKAKLFKVGDIAYYRKLYLHPEVDIYLYPQGAVSLKERPNLYVLSDFSTYEEMIDNVKEFFLD